MQLIANTLALSAELRANPPKSSFMFDSQSTWYYHADLWLGNPNDCLAVEHGVDATKVIGRGMFEKAEAMGLFVMSNNLVDARFVTMFHDKDGLPVLPGGFLGIDINHPGTNTGAESFEMRFIAANFEEKIYAFGFCASDPGEPDIGIFIATNSRKQATLCYQVAKAAQRLHGNHARLQEFICKMLSDKNNKE